MRDATVYAIYVTDLESGVAHTRLVSVDAGEESDQDDIARHKAESVASLLMVSQGRDVSELGRFRVQIREYGEFRLPIMGSGDEWSEHGRKMLAAAALLSESGVDICVDLDRDVTWPEYEIEVEVGDDEVDDEFGLFGQEGIHD